MRAFEVFCRSADRAIADLVASGPESLVNLAREHDARWHPNGFLVFDLGPCRLGTMRLHIWPNGPRLLRDTAAHLHTHVWDLYSRVLIGRYEERMYEAVPIGTDGAREFNVARVDYARDRNTLMHSSVSHLRPGHMVSAESGETHAVQAGEVHETLIPSESFVATLLIVSPQRLDEAMVYSEHPLPPPDHVRRVLSRAERDAVLDELRVGLIEEFAT